MSPRLLLIVGGSREQRAAAALEQQAQYAGARIVTLRSGRLPFVRVNRADLPASPRVVRIEELDRAFPNHQQGGTRLILTQSTYLLHKWLDVLEPEDLILATADQVKLYANAPEAVERRGLWRLVELLSLGVPATVATTSDSGFDPEPDASGALEDAFSTADTTVRLALCRDAMRRWPDSEIAALSLASACRETQDLNGARQALGHALALAPEWEAAHYEEGKLWLSCEQLEPACAAFARAGQLMPGFSAAHSNHGATLGELGQPEAALAAFQLALQFDPDSFMVLNNLGVVNRELGRLADSEAALARVVTIAPGFVFGHYNLGHTRFLAGNYAGALRAYEEGQRRDPQKNRRQGCRLAVVRLAVGDWRAAERDLWHFADQAPAEEREDLLLEAYETARALLQREPQLASHQSFLDRIAAEFNP